ncbi:hypothetical protein GCM10012290_17080 [Halolactibacillus alkaliphilus]|uniref:hypothetical protein n=1 Tax=Halolactibacillus alkaliphilus TaxID=442899 RepID=UPI001668977E|nr:hypothetical protein [Halolactibacillus alkaliphilus]GGN71758.1 hypothetical protein GCM10012290_17080 [Halolactibacillus alkaliphilus]
MTISGRKDAKSGNFVFHYHPETHTLTFKAINQCVISLSGVVFPYGQDHVHRAIQTQMNLKDKKKYGKPIGWSLEDHGDYYIVKCFIDVPATPYLNTSTSTGMVGVDLNVNHIAVANVNAIGQCVDTCTLPFDLEGKTSGQKAKIIEAEAIARRAMGFKEKLPPMLYSLVPEQKQGLHHWAHWAYMTRTLSFFRTHVF